jgi:hypothetical protein
MDAKKPKKFWQMTEVIWRQFRGWFGAAVA